MSYQAYSKVVFGLEVSKETVFIENKQRGCCHDVDLTAKFCSECGKPMNKIVKEQIINYGSSDQNKLGYFISSYDSDETGILGFILAQTKDQDLNYYVIPQPKEEMVNKLKEFLMQYNIRYNDNELKSYLYTYHSY